MEIKRQRSIQIGIMCLIPLNCYAAGVDGIFIMPFYLMFILTNSIAFMWLFGDKLNAGKIETYVTITLMVLNIVYSFDLLIYMMNSRSISVAILFGLFTPFIVLYAVHIFLNILLSVLLLFYKEN